MTSSETAKISAAFQNELKKRGFKPHAKHADWFERPAAWECPIRVVNYEDDERIEINVFTDAKKYVFAYQIGLSYGMGDKLIPAFRAMLETIEN